MAYISIDIDLEDIYDGLSKYDKGLLLDWLKEDDILSEEDDNEIKNATNNTFQLKNRKHNLIKTTK
mgnify:CR=1 FL=1